MGIRQLDCIRPYVRDEASAACLALRTKDLPNIDLLRVNPAGYVLSRMLAPGQQDKPTVDWLAPRRSTRLIVGNGIHCETMPGRSSAANRRCIALFHGNTANACETIDQFAPLREFAYLIAVNAPGYGATPAPKNHRQLEWQMAANVQAVAAHIARSYDAQDVLWLGFSLGSAQAAMGFQDMPGSHLLLDAPFTHVRALVETHVGTVTGARSGGWLSGVLVGCGMGALPKHWRVPGSAFATDGLNTESKLRRCAATHRAAGSQLGIIFAEHDEIMPGDMPQKLWEAYHGAGAPADGDVVHCLRGVGHNGSCSDDPEARQAAYNAHLVAARWSVYKLFGLDTAVSQAAKYRI